MTDGYDASDPAHVKERRRAAQFADERRRAILDHILQTRDGRSFVRELLAQCGIGQSTFTADALTTAYNAGKQDVGRWLMADLTHPDLSERYIAMLTEEVEDVERDTGSQDRNTRD